MVGPRHIEHGRGFTLVELCIGLAVGSILVLGMMTLLRGGLRAFSGTSEQLEALQAAQLVSEIIREDLHNAVLSGLTAKPKAGTPTTTPGPDLTPFEFDPAALGAWGVPGQTPQAGGPQKPPVLVPKEPIDLSDGVKKFVFYRTFRLDKSKLGSLPAPEPMDSADASWKPDEGYVLARVTYSLEVKEHTKLKQPYYHFIREVEDGKGDPVGSIPPKRIYKNLKLRHLIFMLHERDRTDIAGLGKAPPAPPASDPFSIALGGTPSPPPPPDFTYYIQWVVTGLSSQARIQDFKDFRQNTLVNVVCFEALSEMLLQESAGLFWNNHSVKDGWLVTGPFEP